MCSWGVAWALVRIPPEKIRYLPVQSDEGAAIMAKAGIDTLFPQTIVVTDGDLTYIKSQAVLVIMKMCGGVTSWMANALGLLPASFLDALYLWIGKRRYRIFGQLNSCYVPPANNRS